MVGCRHPGDVLGEELPDRPPVAEMDPNLSVKAGHSEETLMELRMQAFAEHGFVSAISSTVPSGSRH